MQPQVSPLGDVPTELCSASWQDFALSAPKLRLKLGCRSWHQAGAWPRVGQGLVWMRPLRLIALNFPFARWLPYRWGTARAAAKAPPQHQQGPASGLLWGVLPGQGERTWVLLADTNSAEIDNGK